MIGFWTFFIDKNHFTVLLMLVLVLGGAFAALALPKESTPDISIPLGIVSTALPGASASDVERLVTDKIEDAVLGVERVSKVSSVSGEGFSSVSVEFDASANIEKSIQLLKDAVDTARPELPDEATDPVVSDVNFADQPVLIVSISGALEPAELTALGEDVQDELERVQGVASVALSGVRERQVQVIVSQEKLAQFGLSLSDVTQAIAAAGIGSPAGSIVVEGVTYAVRFDAGIASTEDVADTAILGPGRASLRVRDVAEVVDGLADATSYSRVSVEGEPANPSLTLTIMKNRGGNIVETAEAVKHRLKELGSGMLASTDTVIAYDGAEEVAKSLTELTRAGIETVILVVLVLFLTLGWRESLVAAASIPLSFLIAFLAMLASGNTLNNVSLFSLILAIGILVDSGVVVVEAYHTRLRTHGSPRDAARAAIREYGWPLIAGTFTTIVVFVPLFFLSGIVGKFLASIPYTVIFVLIASIFVALGFVPLLSMKFVKAGHSKLEVIQERYNALAHDWYQRFLRGVLHDRKTQNRFLIGMGLLFVLALALPMTGLLKSIFFPSGDYDFVFINIERPQGTALSSTDLSVREVEEILYRDDRIESFVTVVGSASAFSSSIGEGAGSGGQIANITVNLPKDHKESSAEFVRSLREDLAAVTSAAITVGEPEGGPPAAAPVTVTFTGDDLGELTATAERAANVLAEMPGTVNVSASTRGTSAEFVVRLDGPEAATLGVSAPAVANALRTALFSAKATSIRAGSEDIEVRTKLDLNPDYADPSETTHVSIDAVRALSVMSANGPVLLSSVADVSYEPAQTLIRHEDGARVVSVTAEVSKGANAIEITEDFRRQVEENGLGNGITMKLGGESEDVAQSFLELFIALIAGAALMLGILVLEFNSFRHSLYLLLLIPLSLIGVHAGLTLMGQPLSLTSMLGVIALAGVIINHAIILMDSMSRIGREGGHSLEDVVVEASSSRLRPIVLTTVVTVIGMIPLAFADPFWAPLAFSIMFGLAFSLLLTLLLVPILYYRWPGKETRARFAEGLQPALPPARDSEQPVLP